MAVALEQLAGRRTFAGVNTAAAWESNLREESNLPDRSLALSDGNIIDYALSQRCH